MWAMSKKDAIGENSFRPNLADIPAMEDMLALYDKVLLELDSAISSQRSFSEQKSGADSPSKESNQ